MKILLIAPGASWSTADVHAGLLYGLQHHQVPVVQFRLDARLARSSRWLYAAWRSASRKQTIDKPNDADVFYDASIGSLGMAFRFDVDLVLAVSAMYFHPDILGYFKRAGIRTAVLFTESPYDQPYELKITPVVSGCWTNERSSLPAFRRMNPMSGYLPHAWHPERHKPGPQPGDENVPAHDVVFIGSCFQERIAWLSDIDWTGIDLGLYGMWNGLSSRHPLRKFVRGNITSNEMTAALYRRCKIGLNLYRTSMGWGKGAPHIQHAESLNPRAYELAACGVFHVSTYRAEVSEVFGDLVPTFESPAEASTLIREWLAADVERDIVARQLPGCVREMSWVDRSAAVIRDLQYLLRPTVAATSHPQSTAVGATPLGVEKAG